MRRELRNVRLPRFLLPCMLLVGSLAPPAHATLPRGYREDFNGCATQSPSASDRDRCCLETFDDCQDQCKKDTEGDPGAGISCSFDCTWALDKCKEGTTVRVQPGWPGIAGAVVPGLMVDRDRAQPETGYDLVASRSAVLVDLRSRNPAARDVCVALVIACQCPAGAAGRGEECRASMEGNSTACRICRAGDRAEACKPCPDCRPELLSAQPCVATEVPAARGHAAESRPKER